MSGLAVSKRTPKGTQLAIVYTNVSDLHPHPLNPRTHSEMQVSQIVTSIRQFGWTVPIVIDEAGMVLAGHGRLAAATRLDMANVPTITVPGLSDEAKRAYVIADNRLSDNAEWDIPLLMSELEYLSTNEFPHDMLGFSDYDLTVMDSNLDDTGFEQVSPDVPDKTLPSSGGRPGRVIESLSEPTQLQEDEPGYVRPSDALGGPDAALAATLVPFNVMLPQSDRERLYAALNIAKGDLNLTTAEAIMVIVEDWVEGESGSESDSESNAVDDNEGD